MLQALRVQTVLVVLHLLEDHRGQEMKGQVETVVRQSMIVCLWKEPHG